MCGWNNTTSTDYNDLWAYHPATDTWVQKASLPGPPRYAGVAFSINGIGYFGTGAANATWYNDLYAFDPTTNTWEQKTNFPGNGRRWAVGFAAEGKGYIGTGESSGIRYRDFYAYDPFTDTWQQRADLGSNNRRNGYAFVVDGHAYVGGGQDFIQNWNDFHRYDVNTDSWLPAATFPLAACKNGTCFSTGEEAFIVGGNGQSPVLSHAWRFSPDISTAMSEEENLALHVYPNPANDQLVVHGADRAAFTIHDALGRSMQHGVLNAPVDVRTLPEGPYVLRIVGMDRSMALPFLVRR